MNPARCVAKRYTSYPTTTSMPNWISLLELIPKPRPKSASMKRPWTRPAQRSPMLKQPLNPLPPDTTTSLTNSLTPPDDEELDYLAASADELAAAATKAQAELTAARQAEADLRDGTETKEKFKIEQDTKTN